MLNTDSDTESEDLSTQVSYSHQPEWSDVVPIEQDDGSNPVVKIDYSDQFRETFDYIRARMQSNEMSERTLELTKTACQLNPANYTVWCYRCQILYRLKCDLNEELTFIAQMIKENPKKYQVWEHRRLIVERSDIVSNELPFLSTVINNDSKNYHAWQYRQWLLKTYSLWLNELDYVDQLINDIRNNSAWNQRYFVIAHTTGFKEDIIECELDYVEKHIELCPDNESAWNYLRGIARFRSLNLTDQHASNEFILNSLSTVRYAEFCLPSCHNGYETIHMDKRLVPFTSTYMPHLQTLRLWRPDDFPWTTVRPDYKRYYDDLLPLQWLNSLEVPESIAQHVIVFEQDLCQLIDKLKDLTFLDIYGKTHYKKVEPYRLMVQARFPDSRVGVDVSRFRLWL